MRVKISILVIGLVFGAACDGDDSVSTPFEPAEPVDPGTVQNDDTFHVGFDGLPPGTIVDGIDIEGFGRVGIRATSSDLGPGVNGAVVFDSSDPGEDTDLGTPHEDFGGPGTGEGGARGQPFENGQALGNLLIAARDLVDVDPADGLVDEPNDASGAGNSLEFDFSGVGEGAVEVVSITIVDVDRTEPRAVIELIDSQDRMMTAFTLPDLGDNGVGTFSLGPTSGVARVVVRLGGSGAVDQLTFVP